MKKIRGKLEGNIIPVPSQNPLAYEIHVSIKCPISSNLIGGNFTAFNIAIQDTSTFAFGTDGIGLRIDRPKDAIFMIIPQSAVAGLIGLQILALSGSTLILGPLAKTVRLNIFFD